MIDTLMDEGTKEEKEVTNLATFAKGLLEEEAEDPSHADEDDVESIPAPAGSLDFLPRRKRFRKPISSSFNVDFWSLRRSQLGSRKPPLLSLESVGVRTTTK